MTEPRTATTTLDAVVVTEPRHHLRRRTGTEVSFRVRAGHDEHEVFASGPDYWPIATVRIGERVRLIGAFEPVRRRRSPRYLAKAVER